MAHPIALVAGGSAVQARRSPTSDLGNMRSNFEAAKKIDESARMIAFVCSKRLHRSARREPSGDQLFGRRGLRLGGLGYKHPHD